MPFQDIDETTAPEVPEPPGTVERLARKIFLEDLGLKLLALGITLVIWFAVTSENKPITIRAAVQLNFVRPANLEIGNDPPRTVDAILNGSRQKLDSLTLLDLVATVDLQDSKAGERVVRLTPQRVAIELPEGVRIESFQPSTISVRLEPRVERQLPVEVRIDGTPAEGTEVYGTTATPSTVKIQGPASHVGSLQRAATETVSVAGKRENFSVPGVAIDVSNQKVEVVDPVVDLFIEIGERRIERQFDNVAVRSRQGDPVLPSVASVTLLGPASAIAKLQSEEIAVVVNKSSAGESNPQLQLPSDVQHVRLVSIRPTVFQ